MDSYELILPIYPFRSPFWLLWISLYRLPLVQNLLSVQDVRYKKTIIFFTLLACFPGHVCTQNVVEKKGNQRFLKLQFLYFIGMEAWRLYSSHNFVKTWPVSKETGLFYVNITLCKPKKHTWFPCSSNILVIRICVMLRLNCTTTQLTQMSPNIPYSQDFWTFEHIGHP